VRLQVRIEGVEVCGGDRRPRGVVWPEELGGAIEQACLEVRGEGGLLVVEHRHLALV